jgi:hypothetical protein
MFSFHHPHNRFSHVRERTCWIAFSLLLAACSGGSSTPHRLQSQLQEHPVPKPPWESDCLSKPDFPKLLRRTWILVGT